MTDKLLNLSIELKEIISDYNTAELLTYIAGLIIQSPTRNENPAFKNLKSPLRQLFYLALLNLESTKKDKSKKEFKIKEWDKVSILLDEIEKEYFLILGFTQKGKQNDSDVTKLMATVPNYLNYFFNGPLSFVEQEIARIQGIFTPFDNELKKLLGLSLDDFIKFYYFLDAVIEKNLNFAFKTGYEWAECIRKGIKPEDWQITDQESFEAWGKFIQNPGSFLVLNVDKIDFQKFEKEIFLKIIDLFRVKEETKTEITLYTEKNEILNKPFYKINDSEYLPICFKQFLTALYEFLFEFCKKNINTTKAFKHRDSFLESKTTEIFKDFFNNDAFYYNNYSIDNNISEQDLLIIYKRNIIIVEMKAAMQREPMRDFEKAYKKLESDFKKTVQKGYEQCYRVKKIFKTNNCLNIISINKQKLYNLKDYKKYNIHSLIVTNDRLGLVQTDLFNMLEFSEDDDKFPWCINIDDLEVFLLALKKRSSYKSSFITFLNLRETLHGHLICADELELCGYYFINNKQFKKYCDTISQDKYFITHHETSLYFDRLYDKGLGFKNEINMQKKKDSNTYSLYSQQ